MKLIIVIIQDKDKRILLKELIDKNYRVTKLASTGGFLEEGNTTLLIGVEEEKLDECISIIEENCKRRKVQTTMIDYSLDQTFMPSLIEVTVGGAVIFVLDVEEFKTL